MGRKYSDDDDDSDHDRRRRRSGHRNERRRDDRHRRREDYDDEYDRRPRRKRDVEYELEDFHHKAPKSSPRKFPTKVDRSCTDIIFLILFILVVLFWVVIVAATYAHVNIGRLINLPDSAGNICGYDPDVRDTTMYYVSLNQRCTAKNPGTNCVSPTCVKKCPSKYIIDYALENETSIDWDEIVCSPEARNKILGLNGTERFSELMNAIQNDQCDQQVYATTSFFKLCLPVHADTQLNIELEKKIGKHLKDAISIGGSVLAEVSGSYTYMLGGLGLALILSLFWMLFMRYFAGIVIWVSVILYPLTFGGLTGFCAYMAYRFKEDSEDIDDIFDEAFDFGIQGRAFLVFAVLAGLFGFAFVVISLILLFLRKRIAVAVALIKQASRSIASLPTLVVFPIIPYILQILGIAAVFTVSLMIYILQNEMGRDNGAAINRTCNAHDVGNPEAVGKVCEAFVTFLGSGVYIHIYNVLAGLWLTCFVEAFNYIVVAHAVSRYFWTRKEEGTKCMAVGSAVGTSLRYHSGTLAFGSLILSILWPVRVAILTIRSLLLSLPVALPIVLSFCTVTVDPILRYLNKNGYVMVAMYGKNFCVSAAKAFALIVRNILRTIVITSVTDFLIFVSKLVISVLTGFIMYFIIKGFNVEDFNNTNDLIFVLIIVGIIAVASFIVTSVFFDVYRNIVDTLFICFLEDKKIHDGSRQRPYMMSSELMKILNKKNYR